MSAIEKLQARGRAAPGWFKGPVLATVFLLPIWWVIGQDNLFDVILAWTQATFGPETDRVHLFSYLVCVLILLVPAVVAIQLVGARRLRRQAEAQSDAPGTD